ncbi:MAG TPA: tRNA (N6-threonylcarbamoyladenosine(37)-N6)-methyltransferase TrmO [Anaerolineales bacterium]|nr:tRNA (N6-threonylcarbamoyladenosine(37)-N6)-methyltransferase TrmO [Anaerolineales bacterium]
MTKEEKKHFIMQPIGTIHSPFSERAGTPIQAARSQAKGTVEIYPEFVPGLQDLEGFSHIILLYVFHKSSGYALHVTPFLDTQLHGLFATRYPARPNPIGLSVVRLTALRSNILEVEGVDMLDGTPLLDIKPYVPEFDIRNTTHNGWYDLIKG